MHPALALGLPVVKTLLRIPARALPYRIQGALLAPALNRCLRTTLRDGAFGFLENRAVRIRVSDLEIDWLLTFGDGRLRAIDRTRPGDVCITGSAQDFALLASRRADPDTLFFQRRLRIEGDTELGLGVKNTLDAMDWDDLPSPLRRLLQAL